MMDARGLPLVSPGIDLRTLDPMNPRRLLSFVNHFVAHSVSFLNKFSCSCEERLERVSVRVEKVEATLQILEAKLSSITGLENVGEKPSLEKPAEAGPTSSAPPSQTSEELPLSGSQPPPTVLDDPVEEIISDTPSDGVKAKDHPNFKRYFRMISMGVPLQAAKNQMAAEISGVDVEILENPDRRVELDSSLVE